MFETPDEGFASGGALGHLRPDTDPTEHHARQEAHRRARRYAEEHGDESAYADELSDLTDPEGRDWGHLKRRAHSGVGRAHMAGGGHIPGGYTPTGGGYGGVERPHLHTPNTTRTHWLGQVRHGRWRTHPRRLHPHGRRLRWCERPHLHTPNTTRTHWLGQVWHGPRWLRPRHRGQRLHGWHPHRPQHPREGAQLRPTHNGPHDGRHGLRRYVRRNDEGRQVSKVSDTLAQFEGQFIVPTQTDLMTVGKIPGWEREAYGGTRFPDIGKGHGWAADSKAAASKLRNSAVAGKKYGEKSLVVPISTSKYGALSNSTVANEIARRIRQGQLKPEDIQGIEHYLKRKAPTEGNSLEQFLDPDFLRNATFNQRGAFGEAVGSYGSNKKGSKANPRAAAGHSLPDIERLLEESMDPHWKGLDNPLLHGGNRLISLEDYVDESGDFHPDYPPAIRGKKEADLSQAVPGNLLFRDQSDQVKRAHAAGQTNKKDLDFYHFMVGLPLRQQITDDYLRNLQSHGYAEGGRVARGLTPEQHAVLGGKHKDHPVYSKPFGEGKHGVYHGSRDLQRQAKADWAAHEAEVAAKPRYGMVAGKMQQLEKLANGGTITDKAKRYAESIGKSYDPSLGMSADTGEDKQVWIGRAPST